MSQFDFPRINFFGKTTVNVATCNNDDFKPAYTPNGSGLMVHDIVHNDAYLPPRVYVTEAVMQAIMAAHVQSPDTVPAYDYVLAGVSMGVDYYYVAVATVVTPELFVTWAKVPMGQSTLDTRYHPLYTYAQLAGTIPAEWNFNGGMQFVIHDCSVVSVAVMPSDNSGGNVYLASAPGDCPSDLAAFLGASFNSLNAGGANTTTICDLNPAAPYSSQYFTQSYFLRQQGSDAVLMSGAPMKGITRWINFGRVVNIPGSPMIASGSIFQAIPKSQMSEWSQLEAVFLKYGQIGYDPIGALVRFDLFEVYEDRQPDYATMDEFATNPAYMSVVGSITPWYEGEMGTASMGRVLNPTQAALTSTQIGPVSLAPITFKVKPKYNLVSYDLFNTLPENRNPADFPSYPNGNTPPQMSYELYPLGTMTFQAGGNDFGSISPGPDGYTRQMFIDNGGIFDYVYDLPQGAPDPSTVPMQVSLSPPPGGSTTGVIMAESQVVVQSDQSGAYANLGDPSDNLLSQGIDGGPVLLRVMNLGNPVPQSSPVIVTQTVFGLDCTFNLVQQSQSTMQVYDGMPVDMDTSQPMILLYVYTPAGTALPTPTTFAGTTEFYLNLRVLPDQSGRFQAYYLPKGAAGAIPLTWDVLYAEIFYSYYMMYPAMTQQMPLNDAASWSEPFAAGRLMQVISQDMWDQPWYMPRTRDLSNAQRQLINTWAQGIVNGNS